MKSLILVLVLLLPTNLYAANLDLTFAVEGPIDRGEAVLTINDHVEVFYEEARDYEADTTETTKGVTFSFSFDWKKGD